MTDLAVDYYIFIHVNPHISSIKTELYKYYLTYRKLYIYVLVVVTMFRKSILISFVFVALLISGCSTGSDNNFILYVSDQSFDVSPVDVKVYIDDQLMIDEEFEVGNQHNWKKFEYKLSKGQHTLKAVSEKGDAVLEEEFVVLNNRWAALNYWSSETEAKKFTVNIQSTPIYFQ